MSLELDEYQLEYVTGLVTLPPTGDAPSRLWPLIAVTNVGRTAAHTRTLVYRTRRNELNDAGFDLVLDSDVNNAIYGEPLSDVVPPGKTWDWGISDWSSQVGAGTFWFSIRVTSPSLVPSIEFKEVEPEPAGSSGFGLLQTLALRYAPGDFAVFHHQLRVLPPVVVPGGTFLA